MGDASDIMMAPIKTTIAELGSFVAREKAAVTHMTPPPTVATAPRASAANGDVPVA